MTIPYTLGANETARRYFDHLEECEYCRHNPDWCSLGFKLRDQNYMERYYLSAG